MTQIPKVPGQGPAATTPGRQLPRGRAEIFRPPGARLAQDPHSPAPPQDDRRGREGGREGAYLPTKPVSLSFADPRAGENI